MPHRCLICGSLVAMVSDNLISCLCKPYILQSLCYAALHDDECFGAQNFRPILDIIRNANSKIISTLPSRYGAKGGSVARKRLACWKYEADVSLSLNPSVCTL